MTGYRGSDFFDAGYIYAPYVPLSIDILLPVPAGSLIYEFRDARDTSDARCSFIHHARIAVLVPVGDRYIISADIEDPAHTAVGIFITGVIDECQMAIFSNGDNYWLAETQNGVNGPNCPQLTTKDKDAIRTRIRELLQG